MLFPFFSAYLCCISAEEPFKCPEQFGYYRDGKDCSKYYVCVFGDSHHEKCTGGLHFSLELQTCDWPRNVNCLKGKLELFLNVVWLKNLFSLLSCDSYKFLSLRMYKLILNTVGDSVYLQFRNYWMTLA